MQMMNELGNDMTMDEAKNMIYMFDEDTDGFIDFPEFVKLMMYDTVDENVYQQLGERSEIKTGEWKSLHLQFGLLETVKKSFIAMWRTIYDSKDTSTYFQNST